MKTDSSNIITSNWESHSDTRDCPCLFRSLCVSDTYRSSRKLADQLIYRTPVSINYQLYTGYANFCNRAAACWIAIAIAQNVARGKVVGSSVAAFWNVPRISHVFAKPYESRCATCALRQERRQGISDTWYQGNVKINSEDIKKWNTSDEVGKKVYNYTELEESNFITFN